MSFGKLGMFCLLAGGAALVTAAETSPYAGMAHAEIKALSADEQAMLLDGKGMGFAKAAELNGYPGPAHVLELSAQLELTAKQIEQTRAVFERMQADARADGAALVEAERALDRLYASRTATAASVNGQLARIEATRAHLRGVHLNAHLAQADLLTTAQIARYSALRGYAAGHHGH
jgi:Spy/CpxP family protein refolding chaperone